MPSFLSHSRPAILIATLAATLAAGACTTGGELITVGSIPDDYRTNHPIVIGERERKIDIPVRTADHRMTKFHRSALHGFLANYDRDAAAPVTVVVPRGSANEVAAANVAGELMGEIASVGVPRHRIAIAAYRADARESNAPIRVVYAEMAASTGKCGRWPEDIGDTAQNRHYANFGCSYQNNLAAQIANPADLLTPRETTAIDAENRGNAIVRYKDGQVADDFQGNSEVEYE